MKKGILLAMSMAFAVAGFASCGHTHTFDATAWQSDANMHWRKATCEHTTEKYAVDVHTDANVALVVRIRVNVVVRGSGCGIVAVVAGLAVVLTASGKGEYERQHQKKA